MMNKKINLVPDAMKSAIICVDSYREKLLCGRLYLQAVGTERKFNNAMQMLFLMEASMDNMCFPEEYTRLKVFSDGSIKLFDCEAAAEVKEVESGALATFKVKVIFRQNASWQGIISWLDGAREESFRSVYEMLMLIDSALEKAADSSR